MTLGWYLAMAIGGAAVVFVGTALLGGGPWMSLALSVAWVLVWKLIGPVVVSRRDRFYL